MLAPVRCSKQWLQQLRTVKEFAGLNTCNEVKLYKSNCAEVRVSVKSYYIKSLWLFKLSKFYMKLFYYLCLLKIYTFNRFLLETLKSHSHNLIIF